MSAPTLLRVGFWAPVTVIQTSWSYGASLLEKVAELFRAPLPNAAEAVDRSWSGPERQAVLDHLAHEGWLVAAEYGDSACRLCGEANGNKEYSDGVYVWPEGFAHYIREHGVKPPDAFIEHARGKKR